MPKSSKGRQDPFVVDFSDTESREGKKSSGRFARVPEGDYLVKCTGAKWDKSSEKETPGVFTEYTILKPESHKGKKLGDRLWISDKALWRLRQTLEAMGIEVPSKKVKVDPKKMIGKTCAVTVEDDEYEGKVRSQVVDTFRKQDFEELAKDDDAAEDEEGEADEDEDEDEGDEDDAGEEDDEDDDEDDDEEDDELEAIDL